MISSSGRVLEKINTVACLHSVSEQFTESVFKRCELVLRRLG